MKCSNLHSLCTKSVPTPGNIFFLFPQNAKSLVYLKNNHTTCSEIFLPKHVGSLLVPPYHRKSFSVILPLAPAYTPPLASLKHKSILGPASLCFGRAQARLSFRDQNKLLISLTRLQAACCDAQSHETLLGIDFWYKFPHICTAYTVNAEL